MNEKTVSMCVYAPSNEKEADMICVLSYIAAIGLCGLVICCVERYVHR